jgi:aldehyde:ferredoxin oxidoreductase
MLPVRISFLAAWKLGKSRTLNRPVEADMSLNWSATWIARDPSSLKPSVNAEVLNAITGWNLSATDLLISGERANNLCRCFNAREGLTRKDDYLPPRFTEDPLPDGPSKGHRLSREQLEEMLDNYYDIRGWDKKTGNPTAEKLKGVGLEFA